MLLEPRSVKASTYSFVQYPPNWDKFDAIWTYDQTLLDFRADNIGYFPSHNAWVPAEARAARLEDKTKLVSAVVSKKASTPGHRFRQAVLGVLQEWGKADLWGEAVGRHLDSKGELSNARYQVVVENTAQNYYMSEKLVDAILVGSIPIYNGVPDPYSYFAFNATGLITFRTLDELRAILNFVVSEEDYLRRFGAAQQNLVVIQSTQLSLVERIRDTIASPEGICLL